MPGSGLGLSEEVTSEQRPEESEGATGRGPEVGESLAHARR